MVVKTTIQAIMKICFCGHRDFFDLSLKPRLKKIIENEIKNGNNKFILGSHGKFDGMVYGVLSELKELYGNIQIEVVLTSLNGLNTIKKDFGYNLYSKAKTVMYEIEDSYFKARIELSNKKMIDECEKMICYIDDSRYRSGAKKALRYAQKQGLTIINLYNKR